MIEETHHGSNWTEKGVNLRGAYLAGKTWSCPRRWSLNSAKEEVNGALEWNTLDVMREGKVQSWWAGQACQCRELDLVRPGSGMSRGHQHCPGGGLRVSGDILREHAWVTTARSVSRSRCTWGQAAWRPSCVNRESGTLSLWGCGGVGMSSEHGGASGADRLGGSEDRPGWGQALHLPSHSKACRNGSSLYS